MSETELTGAKPKRKYFRRAQQPTDREAFLRAIEALENVAKEQSAAFKAQAEALTKQMEAFAQYLTLFKVTDPPEGRVIRDEDEWRMEQERAEQMGFSPTANGVPTDLYRYILQETIE